MQEEMDKIENKEQLTNSYKDKIEAIKEINQKTIGTENKINELTKQRIQLQKTVEKNKQELGKY